MPVQTDNDPVAHVAGILWMACCIKENYDWQPSDKHIRESLQDYGAVGTVDEIARTRELLDGCKRARLEQLRRRSVEA